MLHYWTTMDTHIRDAQHKGGRRVVPRLRRRVLGKRDYRRTDTIADTNAEHTNIIAGHTSISDNSDNFKV